MFPGVLAILPVKPTYVAFENTNVSLMVYVAGYPEIKLTSDIIVWNNPGNMRLPNQMLLDNNKTLMIQGVSISDSGTYMVNLRRHVISNKFLKRNAAIELKVFSKLLIMSQYWC